MPIDETFIRGDLSLESKWREHLTDKSYVYLHPPFDLESQEANRAKHRHTIAYVDLFDQETQSNGGDWKKVVNKYLFSGNEPLVNGILGGRESPNPWKNTLHDLSR